MRVFAVKAFKRSFRVPLYALAMPILVKFSRAEKLQESLTYDNHDPVLFYCKWLKKCTLLRGDRPIWPFLT